MAKIQTMVLLAKLKRNEEVLASIRRNIPITQIAKVREGFYAQRLDWQSGELIHLKGKERICLGKF